MPARSEADRRGRRPALAGAALAALSLLAISPASADERRDAELERAARLRLSESPELSRRSIDASVREGVAVLSGAVETLAERRDALRVVGRVAGLRHVRSRLRIATAGRGDNAIRSDVRRAFETRLVLLDSGVEVSVDGGVVTLSGEARNGETKSAARRAVETVRGVVALEDGLTTPETSDESLLRRAQRLFARRGRVILAGSFDVAVEGGVLFLTGEVPRPYERLAAGELPLSLTGLRGLAARIDVEPPSHEVPVVRPR